MNSISTSASGSSTNNKRKNVGAKPKVARKVKAAPSSERSSKSIARQILKKKGNAKSKAALAGYLEWGALATKSGLSPTIFHDRQEFISSSRQGIPGNVVKKLIKITGLRDTFVAILDVSSSNLSREYQKRALSSGASEAVLDLIRTLEHSSETWGEEQLSMKWLESQVAALGGERPKDLLTTFEGRRWVRQALDNIAQGEFS